ncbi:50S ribosomal protein L25/general stress protein Ctc [Tichowtungia aerotolerans]|uniref:Large ribosomal subunit protein bL25 n=1 Tax=Tichowtungia aerotolerans TaxID=2697043 RepID=A0A6P1MAB8_9BACT|nr:50S ribosomal protein L25/general stress protein Ctc [Tichowtungia aerotolerans]QHI68516.1 50S ribosomal protein L25/general stress protein Ctc [Tichowtungia aerotolerans]
MDAKMIVSSRELKGSSNARRMRRDGQIPGVVYGDGGEARPVSLPAHEFEQMLHHHAGEQMMVEIELDGKTESVLLKDVQHDPLSGNVIHVDFLEVALNKKIKVQVPVEPVGEAEGVKSQGGILDHSLYSLDVECLPADILEKIEVDVSALKIGDVMTVKDISIDTSKYTILADEDIVVTSVLAPRLAAETEGEEGAEGAGPEVITEKKEGAE